MKFCIKYYIKMKHNKQKENESLNFSSSVTPAFLTVPWKNKNLIRYKMSRILEKDPPTGHIMT